MDDAPCEKPIEHTRQICPPHSVVPTDGLVLSSPRAAIQAIIFGWCAADMAAVSSISFRPIIKSLQESSGQHCFHQTIRNVGNQDYGPHFCRKVSRLLPETWLATSIAVSNGEYIPLLLGHLGNAQATLLKDLHVL